MTDWSVANREPFRADIVLEDLKHRASIPNSMFSLFLEFTYDRMDAFWERFMGEESPWSADPVINKYKFTNCYRILDRVSQYLISDIVNIEPIYDNSSSEEIRRKLGRIYLFKMFNKIETWEKIPFDLKENPIRYARMLLDWAEKQEEPLYSSAYLMGPPIQTKYRSRTQMYLSSLSTLENELNLIFCETLEAGFNVLKTRDGFGDFLAIQFAMDFAYACPEKVSFTRFVVPGPGCVRGMRRVFGELPVEKMPAYLKMLTRYQTDLFQGQFKWLHGDVSEKINLSGMDFQNLFCEFDKYSRVKYAASDLVRNKKLRHKFVPTYPLPPLTFPKGWYNDGFGY